MALGCILGLITSGLVLTLLWFGVSGVLWTGHTDLAHVLWPSSVMLVIGWRTTIPGIMITISSVAIDCLMYIAILVLFRACIRLSARLSFHK